MLVAKPLAQSVPDEEAIKDLPSRFGDALTNRDLMEDVAADIPRSEPPRSCASRSADNGHFRAIGRVGVGEYRWRDSRHDREWRFSDSKRASS